MGGAFTPCTAPLKDKPGPAFSISSSARDTLERMIELTGELATASGKPGEIGAAYEAVRGFPPDGHTVQIFEDAAISDDTNEPIEPALHTLHLVTHNVVMSMVTLLEKYSPAIYLNKVEFKKAHKERKVSGMGWADFLSVDSSAGIPARSDPAFEEFYVSLFSFLTGDGAYGFLEED